MIKNAQPRRAAAIGSCLTLALLLAACGSDVPLANSDSVASGPATTPASTAGSTSAQPNVVPVGADTVPVPPTPVTSGNAAPIISGSAPNTGAVGVAYQFLPTASDPNGDALTFSIFGKPSWASFDPATGRLSGAPGAADQGNFANISVAVSDGVLSTSLPSFQILVSQAPSKSATLSWTPPTTATDGSTITNLAGYRIYYGTDQQALNSVIQVTNAGLTSYSVGNLNAGTYFFAISAVTADGVEGDRSTVASKVF